MPQARIEHPMANAGRMLAVGAVERAARVAAEVCRLLGRDDGHAAAGPIAPRVAATTDAD
jgi:hypothetical protein